MNTRGCVLTALLMALSCAAHAKNDRVLFQGDRPSIRNQIQSCQTMLVTADQTDDSVGIPFAAATPAQLEAQLREVISRSGPEGFRGGVFYVLGTAFSQQTETQQNYRAVLDRLGLTELGASVRVLTVPDHLVRKKAGTLLSRLKQRLGYFWPSVTRDYQRPQLGEAIGALLTEAAIEIPNVMFLVKTLAPLDATTTVITHAAMLGAYTLYTKSMINWLLRSGTKITLAQKIELFTKQMLLSVPFIANYQVFGNLTRISQYLATHPAIDSLQALGEQLGPAALTLAVVLPIQTIFYSTAITSQFGKWVDAQVGDEDTRIARSLRPWLQSPLLAADAIFLAVSTNLGSTLASLGPLHITTGHVGIVSLTIATNLLFRAFPTLLNKTISMYKTFAAFWQDVIRPRVPFLNPGPAASAQ